MNDKKSVYIKGYSKKYLITSKGEVYTLYKNNNKGERFYQNRLISAYIQLGCLGVNLHTNGKGKLFFMKTLMEKAFGLTPPDKYHYYDLINKDGNVFNCAISNLEYRIRTLADYKFYPQPFYNKRGKITHKICGTCGDKKSVNDFHHQPIGRRAKHVTLRNECESCRGKKRWEKVKADPILFERYLKKTAAWAKSEKGKAYYSNYDKTYTRGELAKSYVAQCLRMPAADLPDALYELKKVTIQIWRARRLKPQTK